MKQKILKQISFLAAALCILMGLLYLILWYSTSGTSAVLNGFAYPGAIGFILIGLGIISLYNTSRIAWTNYFGAILVILTLAQGIQSLFFNNPILDGHTIFQQSNPLNISCRLLIGILFLFWRRKNTPQFLYSFGFFISVLGLGFGVFGLCSHLLGLDAVFEIHYIGLILLMISGLGILTAMVDLELSRQIELYKWVPTIIGIICFIFVVLVSFAIYLNEQLIEKFTKQLIVFHFTGGVLVSLSAALLTYFWLLSKIHLELVRKSEAKFRTFVETTNDWIWEINREGHFTYSNPAIQKILGYSSEEVLGKKLVDYLAPDSQEMMEKSIDNALKIKSGWIRSVIQYVHKDGSTRWLESNAEPIFSQTNEVDGFQGADRNITERVKFEKLQNEFISTVSHDLRTPITSIYGSLGLLSKLENFPEKGKELLGIAYRNAERLTNIINDILDIQTPSTQININIIPVTLATIIKEAMLFSKSFADKFQVTFIEESPLPDIQVYADYDRLVQVMENLLTNAIKFSPPARQSLRFVTSHR